MWAAVIADGTVLLLTETFAAARQNICGCQWRALENCRLQGRQGAAVQLPASNLRSAGRLHFCRR
jgi:hypothetical protein